VSGRKNPNCENAQARKILDNRKKNKRKGKRGLAIGIRVTKKGSIEGKGRSLYLTKKNDTKKSRLTRRRILTGGTR